MSVDVANMAAVVEALLESATEALRTRRLPESTYRVQFHAGFTFSDAARMAPYLHELGVSHCYASPYLKARPGSLHGYAITDHRQLNPEIGTNEDYGAWIAALERHDLGQVLDIVPNHMAIVGNENRWWNDVLENGPASPYAEFFDIDWSASARSDLQGRVLVPILGEPYGKVLEAQQLRLAFEAGEFSIHYFEHRFPVAPESYAQILSQNLEEIERTLGAESPALLEYQSILTAIRNLPPRTEGDPGRLAERQREKEVIKRRLAALAAEQPRVSEFIARAVELFNGRPGEPKTFDLLEKLLDEQAYRLAYWRVAADEINYRRFFDVNDLAALSMERPEVFAATHELLVRLLREGKVSGLRVDHPDGLFDPRQYLRRLQGEFVLGCVRAAFDADPLQWEFNWSELEGPLRSRISADLSERQNPCHWPLYVIVEKILSGDEALAADWPIHGTSGYDFLNAVNGLFVDDAAGQAFTQLYHSWINDDTRFADLAYQKKILILQIALSSELQMLTHQLDRLAQRNRISRDFTWLSLRRALREVIASFPVYRTYIAQGEIHADDSRYILRAVRQAMTRNPAQSSALFYFIRDTLLLKPPQTDPADELYHAEQVRFVGKFQQVTAPVMAKGVEDTAFYVYNRLLSLNEVGGNPDRFGIRPAALHEFFKERQKSWPHALSASSTHDTKRSEDVRARLNVLSEMPAEWAETVSRWSRLNEQHKIILEDGKAPDANEEYFLYQTLLGAWPVEPHARGEYARFNERIGTYMIKALHEAKVHSSWINPNAEYDNAVCAFVKRILDPGTGREFRDDFQVFQRRISHFGMFNALAQTLVKLAAPGVPDVYQGTELWDFSLVDPDNRRAVDFSRRQRLLKELQQTAKTAGSDLRKLARELVAHKEDGRIKLYLLWRTLNFRRQQPQLFGEGEYVEIEVAGAHAENLFAFGRRDAENAALICVPRLLSRLDVAPMPDTWNSSAFADTHLRLPNALLGHRWVNLFTGEALGVNMEKDHGALNPQQLLANFPVCLLHSAAPPRH